MRNWWGERLDRDLAARTAARFDCRADQRLHPAQGGVRKRDEMPVRGLHHLDLAVADVQRSVAFYLALLGPLGV